MRTEIYINKTLIDTNDDFSFSLNFAIADIKSPDKRNSTYSKTITIPGSKTNNKLFTFIFDISKESRTDGVGLLNFAPDFNPNLKADCQIYIDGLLQINGFAQLLDIKQTGDKLEYDIAVFGQLSNLITAIDGIDLDKLDYSEFDHIFNKTNQKNSWDTSIIKNGSAYVNFASGVPTGEGYVYPLINYGWDNDPIKFDVKHLFPAIYLKTYIDKIFSYCGFTYTSDFFETEFFRRLIIPFSGEVIKLSPADLESRKFKANTVAPATYVSNIFYPLIFSNDSTGGAFDNSGVYDTSTGTWTVNKKGDYDITSDIEVTITFTPPAGTVTTFGSGLFYVIIAKAGAGTLKSTNFAIDSTQSGVPFSFQIKDPSRSLEVNDQIQIAYMFIPNFTFYDAIGSPINTIPTYTITFGSGTDFFDTPIINPLLDGDTFLMGSAIPKGVPIKDFFMTIVKMFNLYVSPDPDNEKNLLIEPQKDFYTNNEIIDWTDKLDNSKLIEIKPVSEIQGKEYKYAYKEDKDFVNTDYQNKYNEVYGTKTIKIINDFVKGVVDLGVIFSPSPSYGNLTNNMVIPYIAKRDEQTLNLSVTSGNPRILYYGGLKAVDEPWIYTSEALGTSNEYYYPYAGNLDDPYNPTLDILFGLPQLIYYNFPQGNYTTNNIYNIYHKQFIEEITDKDSKIIIAYFRLRPLDIFKLSFKNFIHVNGINFRLNRIYDYNPLKEDVTKVELAKIKRGIPFVGGTTNIDTNNGTKSFSLIDGSEDEVRSLTATSPIHLLDDGEDIVIGLGSFNNINLVNGGKN